MNLISDLSYYFLFYVFYSSFLHYIVNYVYLVLFYDLLCIVFLEHFFFFF